LPICLIFSFAAVEAYLEAFECCQPFGQVSLSARALVVFKGIRYHSLYIIIVIG
jgi:hypothetical protein